MLRHATSQRLGILLEYIRSAPLSAATFSLCTNKENKKQNNVIRQLNNDKATRQELQERMQYLELHGIPLSAIIKNASLAKLPQNYIIEQLTKYLHSNITKQEMLLKLCEGLSDLSPVTAEFVILISVLATEFNTSDNLAGKLVRDNLFLIRLKPQELAKRIKYLKEQGLSASEICNNIKILKKAVPYLQEMVKNIHILKETGHIAKDFSVGQWLLQMAGSKVVKKKNHWSQLVERAQILAKVMDVTVDDLKVVDYFCTVGLNLLIKKVTLAKRYGITGKDIINHRHLMSMSYQSLQKVFQHIDEFGIEKPHIRELMYIYYNGNICKSIKLPLQYKYLCERLNMSIEELRECFPAKWMSERIQMKDNIDFMLDQGYSTDDLRKFPMVLGHDSVILKHYTITLLQQPELQPIEQFVNDKFLLLNFIEYFIERSVHFRNGKCINIDREDFLQEGHCETEVSTVESDAPEGELEVEDQEGHSSTDMYDRPEVLQIEI